MRGNFTKYVGIPYRDKGTDPATGLDCWQLVRYFYAQEFRQPLPDYMSFYDSSLNPTDAAQAIDRGLSDWTKVDDPVFGNVLVFRIAASPWHTGVLLDGGNMLHTDRGHGSVIEPAASMRWKHRHYGAYKWRYPSPPTL